MNTEIETLKQEMNEIRSTVIPTGDVVEEQKLLIEAHEQLLKSTNKEIEEIKIMNTEIETLKQEINKIESTVIHSGDVVEEQKLLIEAQEQLLELTNKEIERINSSMVQDEVDKNDLNFTNDVNEWLETIKKIDIENKNTMGTGPNPDRVEDLYGHLNYHYNFDYDIIKNASGYITAPVFKYKNKVEASTYRIFNSIQELKSFLSVKKYLLYMIVVSVASKGLDTVETDHLIIYPKKPMFGKPEVKYTFRGHILE